MRGVRVDLALPRSVDGGAEGGRADGGAGLRIFSSPLLPDAKNVTVPHGSLRRCASSISSSAMQRRQRRRHGRVLKVQCQRRRLSLGATMMGRDRRRRPASWTILQKAEMINRRRGLISVRDALGPVARSGSHFAPAFMKNRRRWRDARTDGWMDVIFLDPFPGRPRKRCDT